MTRHRKERNLVRLSRARCASVVLGLGLFSTVLTACGAGERPTVIPTRGGAAVPAASSSAAGAASQPTSGKQYSAAPTMTIDQNKTYIATIKTNMGDIKVQLDAKNAPITVNSFVFLARDHFYDGVIFHRIIKDFVIQGGDPTGTGSGGPGYKFADEPVKGPYEVGSLAMANSGANTNGSQFFIIEGALGAALPPKYNLFGKTIEGIDVVHKIASIPTSTGDRPTQEVKISTIEISEQ
jgi:cyclophilin family peptidyl-prolyl cis-trans isomerase